MFLPSCALESYQLRRRARLIPILFPLQHQPALAHVPAVELGILHGVHHNRKNSRHHGACDIVAAVGEGTGSGRDHDHSSHLGLVHNVQDVVGRKVVDRMHLVEAVEGIGGPVDTGEDRPSMPDRAAADHKAAVAIPLNKLAHYSSSGKPSARGVAADGDG